MSIFLFKNAMLLDCVDNEPKESAWVAVENNIIKEVGINPPPHLSGAEIVDCKGNTLMPGLIDAHIHIHAFGPDDLTIYDRAFLPSTRHLKAAKLLEDTLYQGITTARDASGADAGFREAQKEGLIAGPRLQVCGRALTMTGGHADPRLPTEIAPPHQEITAVIADGITEVRRAAREELRLGADWIKIMAGGGCASVGDEPDTVQYSPEELSAIVYEAKAVGKKTSAHCYSNKSMKNCAQAGVYSIEHGNLLNVETAKVLKEHGCWLVPTMATYEFVATRGEEFGLPSWFRRKSDKMCEHTEQALSIAFKEGLKIGSGSDVIGSGQPYKTLELELKARIMGPMNAILCTTISNAEMMGISDYVGTIEPGKLADLLIIEGNPLKDIRIFQNRDKILAIVQGGKFVKKIS